jgi:hypothetical protein
VLQNQEDSIIAETNIVADPSRAYCFRCCVFNYTITATTTASVISSLNQDFEKRMRVRLAQK